ncbi:hypothetical protein EV363DRAFT_1397328 [Boletus edulis]|nr:hypothetical protein EV363DRAFT_1397328 [Boletus edulis]
MTTAPPGYNFAKAYGIDSVAGAVIFAILYVPFLFFFIRQAISRPTYVYIVISLFCAIRVGAFVLRALLAGVATEGQHLNVFVAFEVIYNSGFFGLLYSAYTLVLDRGRLSDLPLPDGPFLFRIALVAAVAVGITGAIQSATGSTESTVNTGNTLRKVAIYIFLVLCILVAFQTVLLVRAIASYGAYKPSNTSIGATYGLQILCVISLLLLVREAFFTATSNDFAKQNDENWWYPFAALTEFVAVVLFATPGLVPSRDELPS